MDEQPKKWAGDALAALAKKFRAGGILAYVKQTGPKPEGIAEVDELVAFANVDVAELPARWVAWAEALVPVAYAGGLDGLDITWSRDPKGGPSSARVTVVFAEPSPGVALLHDVANELGTRFPGPCSVLRERARRPISLPEAQAVVYDHFGSLALRYLSPALATRLEDEKASEEPRGSSRSGESGWAPPVDLPLLGLVDTRNERWKAAEARYAANPNDDDLRIITEEQEAFDRSERVAAFLGLGDPWPLPDVLRKLVDAADRLLDGRDHDGLGWEEIDTARKVGRSRLAVWDAGEAGSYQPKGFPTLEAEVLHLRWQRDDLQKTTARLLERARTAEGRQAAAERAAESLSVGLAGAMKAIREGANEALRKNSPVGEELARELRRAGRAAMEREAMAQAIEASPDARPLATSEDRQPSMDEARKAAARLSRARETLRSKVSAHPALGQVYLRSLIVDFLGELADPEETTVEADVSVPEARRVEIRVRASAGTAALLQRILSETLPADYSVEVTPR